MRSSLFAFTLLAGLAGVAAAPANAAPSANGLLPALVALPAADLATPPVLNDGAAVQEVQYYRRRYYRRFYRPRYYRRY